MDTRNLVAFGMLLGVVLAALMKGAISGADVKEVIMLLGGGVIGIAVPGRVVAAKAGITPPPIPPAAIMALLVGSLLVLVSCGHGAPPSPNDPTLPAPSVTLPRDPLAPPFTPFYQHADGGTDR